MKTKEHKESNGCEKYYCWRYGLYKINFWTILKKLLQKNDFRRFPLFEIFAHNTMLFITKCWSLLTLSILFREWWCRLWLYLLTTFPGLADPWFLQCRGFSLQNSLRDKTSSCLPDQEFQVQVQVNPMPTSSALWCVLHYIWR